MLNGLDLFSGIGGMSIALREWIRPIAYCEKDAYCQGILFSRMGNGLLHKCPIWDDITTLDPQGFWGFVDIIYGGFPCQDISVAGHGKGLEGERSGLFFEIIRLAKEIKPSFIFLENVPAIRSRGGLTVLNAIAELGYDSRFCVISAASIGAPHLRERWFLLAHTKHPGSYVPTFDRSAEESIRNTQEGENLSKQLERVDTSQTLATELATNSPSLRFDKGASENLRSEGQTKQHEKSCNISSTVLNYWENTESPVCGVDDAIPHRAHRIRALGNAVVPEQAKEAFKILMGI